MRRIVHKDIIPQIRVLNRDWRYWLLEQQWCHYYSCIRYGYQNEASISGVFIQDLTKIAPEKTVVVLVKVDVVNRKPSLILRLGAGHFTPECACCQEHRGFGISEEDKKWLKDTSLREMLKFPLHPIIPVTTQGVVGGCSKNLFDLIEIPPPRYENTQQDKISPNIEG